MEEVGHRKVAHNTGIMSKLVESAENMVHQVFRIGFLGVGITECSI
jgi:hypothetical protein